MEETKKKSNNNLIIAGLAAVGLSVGGLFLAQSNAETSNTTNVQAQTESVINLPATNEKVNGLQARLENINDALNDQINRREVEMRNERDKLLSEKDKEIDDLRIRIIRLEDLVYFEKSRDAEYFRDKAHNRNK